jgi:hypothetical protein
VDEEIKALLILSGAIIGSATALIITIPKLWLQYLGYKQNKSDKFNQKMEYFEKSETALQESFRILGMAMIEFDMAIANSHREAIITARNELKEIFSYDFMETLKKYLRAAELTYQFNPYLKREFIATELFPVFRAIRTVHNSLNDQRILVYTEQSVFVLSKNTILPLVNYCRRNLRFIIDWKKRKLLNDLIDTLKVVS